MIKVTNKIRLLFDKEFTWFLLKWFPKFYMVFVIIYLMCGELEAPEESDYHYNQIAIAGRVGQINHFLFVNHKSAKTLRWTLSAEQPYWLFYRQDLNWTHWPIKNGHQHWRDIGAFESSQGVDFEYFLIPQTGTITRDSLIWRLTVVWCH